MRPSGFQLRYTMGVLALSTQAPRIDAQAAKLVLLLLIPEKPLKLLVSEPEATHSLRTTGRRFQRTLLSGEGHLIQSS
jgi:hypothetical protein